MQWSSVAVMIRRSYSIMIFASPRILAFLNSALRSLISSRLWLSSPHSLNERTFLDCILPSLPAFILIVFCHVVHVSLTCCVLIAILCLCFSSLLLPFFTHRPDSFRFSSYSAIFHVSLMSFVFSLLSSFCVSLSVFLLPFFMHSDTDLMDKEGVLVDAKLFTLAMGLSMQSVLSNKK